MTTKKLTIYILLFLFGNNIIKAQEYFSFYNLGDYIPQTQNVSPVYFPNNSLIFVGMPINSMQNLDAGFRIDELLVENETTNKLKIEFDKLLALAKGKNNLNSDINLSLVMVAIKIKKSYFSVFANLRTTINWQYTKDLLQIATNEVTDFNLVNDKFESTIYSEIGIGITHKFMKEKLSIGLRLKYLNGILHASTSDDAQLNLEIEPVTYAWTVTASNASVNTSALTLEDGVKRSYFTGNSGFGFDIGANYKFNENFSIEFSANDIGFINWSENVINYNIEDQTEVVYEGIDLDTDGNIKDEIERTFRDIIPSNETKESFKTNLTTKTYLSAKYLLAKKNIFRLIFFNNHAFGNFKPSYSLGYNRTINKATFGLSTSAGGSNNTNLKFGANLAFTLGHFQFYTATDDIFTLFDKPEESSNRSIQFGLNLLFYKKKR